MTPVTFSLFDDLDGHEQVVACSDERSGLRAIIAIHSTARGPALGGTRFHAYRSDADALRDVLNLARGMSYKAAMAGLDLGGGKAVILGDPLTDKTPELLRAYGRFVQSLAGRYYTACDVGTYSEDMDVIAQESRFVTGRTVAPGRRGRQLGAHGVRRVPGHAGRRGGDLGRPHARRPHRRVSPGSARSAATWSAPARGRRRGRRLRRATSPPSATLARRPPGGHVPWRTPRRWSPSPIDVYAPCALGDALTDEVVATLQARVVCGAANNQLAHPGVEKQLADRGILYAPDYVVNAGGLIQVADELHGFDFERARRRATLILDTTREVFALAEAEGVPPAVAADRIAEQRMADAAGASGDRGIWLP